MLRMIFGRRSLYELGEEEGETGVLDIKSPEALFRGQKWLKLLPLFSPERPRKSCDARSGVFQNFCSTPAISVAMTLDKAANNRDLYRAGKINGHSPVNGKPSPVWREVERLRHARDRKRQHVRG
jgi:hypothetical protein